MSALNPQRLKNIGVSLSSEERKAVLEELFVFGKENQRPFLDRMAVLLVTSTIIACSGLLSDSVAVVIGAMLVAPMMRPVMSAAAAICLGWSKRLYHSLLLALVMAVAAVLISLLFAWLSPDLVVLPDQVLARTKPTFFDLVIALAAGSAGAYTMTRKESSAIPGVAMAVALLPPLAATGILIVYGFPDLAIRAFILFLTNYAAMVLAGCIVFIWVGVAPKASQDRSAKFTRNYLVAFSALVFATSVPLYFYSTETWYDATYKANQSEELQSWLKTNQLKITDVDIDEEARVLYLDLVGPKPPLNVEQLHTEISREAVKKRGAVKPFKIEVRWTQSSIFTWPPELSEEKDERKLKQDYAKQIESKLWTWIGTEYSDGDWLKPIEGEVFTVQVSGSEKLIVTTACSKKVGSYKFNQENLVVSVSTEVLSNCESFKVDSRFLSDINTAINVNVNGGGMTLRLNNDNGVMHFVTDIKELENANIEN